MATKGSLISRAIHLSQDMAADRYFSESNVNLGGHDVRLIIAQDLGEKAKVVLYDTCNLDGESKLANLEIASLPRSAAGQRSKIPGVASPKRPNHSHAELITELMFGTVPLSYRGTSVRVHPLPLSDSADDRRSFLFTKVFTVSTVSSLGSSTSPTTSSASGSLSSSYGSISAMREYPFPSMTPIKDETTSPRVSSQEFGSRDQGLSLPRCPRNAAKNTQRKNMNPARSHRRDESSGAMSESGDVAPYVPFTKSEPMQTHEQHLSGWLPSPGPVLSRRKRSIDTNGSTSPGLHVSTSRFQPAMCAIGVVFTVPGDGQEDTECALLARYWQMVTRATYALQCVVYDELEVALRFMTAHGTVQTPRSRGRLAKSESQVYQRGRKYYVALGQNCFNENHKINAAMDVFKARLVGGINLPEILRKPLHQDADVLIEELAWTIDALDRKETKFMFSTLMSLLVDFTADLRREKVTSSSTQKNSLRSRLVIVSDDAVLARRLIFCITRLFFRDHNDHLESAVDYALVWPSSGLLGLPSRDLLRRRQSTLAKATRLNHGWDIPGNTRPLSSGSYNMPPISPSIYHRPPSTTSNNSSRASSWKPSWSWFANGSRSQLGIDEQCRSNRSDSRTLQTSWNSADFADLIKSPKEKSPRAWSPNRGSNSKSPDNVPLSSDGTATDDDDESESVETTLAGEQLATCKNDDGSVEVSPLKTASLLPLSDLPEKVPHDEAQSGFPLTGVLSRFHPDMLLQAIPQNAYIDSQLKDYLAEEDLYIHDMHAPSHDSWRPMARMVIAELGNAWRVRKLARLTRASIVTTPEKGSSEIEKPIAWTKDSSVSALNLQETWSDETVTEINEGLIADISKTIKVYRDTKDTACIQHLLDSFTCYGN